MFYGNQQMIMNNIVGKKILKVEGETPLKLTTDDGVLVIDLYGDCCSSSYFSPEGIEDAKSLVGHTISKVEEVDSGNHEPYSEGRSSDYDESTRWHFLKFTTDKGHVTVDWRNDSNGYYDGSVEPSWIPVVPKAE